MLLPRKHRKPGRPIRDLRFVSPFDEDTRRFALPADADFLAVGDFDRDSKLDVVAGSRGAGQVSFLRGNGRGGFAAARPVELGGRLTAMAGGDANRRDGLPDLAVAISGDSPSLLVFEGIGDVFASEPRSIALPGEGTSIAIGQLDENSFTDIAVATGYEVTIIPGSDPRRETAVTPASPVFHQSNR